MSTRDDIERALAGALYAHDPDLRMRHTGEHRCNGPWGIEDVVYHDDCDAARVLATLTVHTRWLRWQQERIEALEEALRELHRAAGEHADQHRSISGDLGARLFDARAALAALEDRR